MGLSNQLSCEAESFSRCRLNPHRCSIRGLKLYFPVLEPWVVWSVSLPSCSSQFICNKMLDCPLHQLLPHQICQLPPCWPAAALPAPLHNPPPQWVCQPLPCYESSPGCQSLPLLPVWMNVSSLTHWLSDFHTVQFSVSSGCVLFLNCCCPSFGCARRHSVSTYDPSWLEAKI